MFAVALFLALLLAFAVAEALAVPLLTDPTSTLQAAGALAGALSIALLSADVVLPLPASIVMTVNGALFGVPLGAALSLVGGVGATLTGVAIGHRSRELVNRLASPRQQRRAERLLNRYGAVAVVATRPVPLLAETTAIMAGTAGMSWRLAALAGLAGNTAPALVYAVAGSVTLSAGHTVLVFVGVVMAAAVVAACTARTRGASDPKPSRST